MREIIKAGEKASQELRDRKNALRRGPVARKKLEDAYAAFAIFQQEEILEDPKQRIRAGKMYAAYLEWESRRTGDNPPPMSMRMFGLIIRRRYVVKRGQGRTILYMGIGLKNPELGQKLPQEAPGRGW